MKKLLFALFALAMIASLGCAVTDYPFITDSRGDYSGLIRTAHKAYIVPSAGVATIYPDGSDNLFSMVLQNQYGDQTLYTFNNYDPTASVLFLDQTYCDWRYEGCEIFNAWNPRQNDDVFDGQMFDDCSGARSLSLLLAMGTRNGECGDTIWSDQQSLASVFADLDTTTWRGGSAYVVPVHAGNTNVTLTSVAGTTESAPIFGNFTGFITEDLNIAVPMTPNARHELNYVRGWVAANGNQASVAITYEGVSTEVPVTFLPDGLGNNAGRF